MTHTCRQLATQTLESSRQVTQRYDAHREGPSSTTDIVVDPELAGGHAWGTNTKNYWHPTAEHEEEQDAAQQPGDEGGTPLWEIRKGSLFSGSLQVEQIFSFACCSGSIVAQHTSCQEHKRSCFGRA
jgi:hypothetical protein